jgi:hypothetical protein
LKRPSSWALRAAMIAATPLVSSPVSAAAALFSAEA